MRGWMELLEERIGMKARFASLSKEIQVVNKEYARVNDYLQAVGLLYAVNGICTETPPPVFPEDEDPVEEQNIPVEEPGEESVQKDGWLKRVRKRFTKFINEGETEEEKNED